MVVNERLSDCPWHRKIEDFRGRVPIAKFRGASDPTQRSGSYRFSSKFIYNHLQGCALQGIVTHRYVVVGSGSVIGALPQYSHSSGIVWGLI